MGLRKPVIGINADYIVNERFRAKNKPSFSTLPSGYYDSVTKAGGIPVVIPPCLSKNDLDQLLETIDGAVMIGGRDLNPENDGFMKHSYVRPLHERRELFDRMLISRLAKQRIPVFGIGAGMQLLNVSQGGTLHLHIPEDILRAIPHCDANDLEHRHALMVLPDSLMGKVYGENEIRVNSMHHMSVDEVADGFLVTAKCPDGVVEAIESIQDDWFAFGTQFHPEANSATAVDVRLFFEFVEGIMKRKGMEIPEFTEEMLFDRSKW